MVLDTKLISIIWAVLITVTGTYGTFTVLGYRVSQAEDDIIEIKSEQKGMVTDEKMQLTLEPIKKDISYTADTVRDIKSSQTRQEEINWKILKQLEHIGASNITADAPHVGGRAVMRSTREDGP
jgi:hypothetical protein